VLCCGHVLLFIYICVFSLSLKLCYLLSYGMDMCKIIFHLRHLSVPEYVL